MQNFKAFPLALGQTAIIYHGTKARTAGLGMTNMGCSYHDNRLWHWVGTQHLSTNRSLRQSYRESGRNGLGACVFAHESNVNCTEGTALL